MPVIATDLDRTLLPNGNQEYDGSMNIFSDIVEEKGLALIYVTGRNLEEINDAVEEYKIPPADYLVAEVGTRVYSRANEGYEEDSSWIETMNSATQDWDVGLFRERLESVEGIHPQEDFRQNRFKLSYYLDNPKDSGKTVREVSEVIKALCSDAEIIYSIDETKNLGLLDVLTRHATKINALEYVRKKLGVGREDIIYCGDSGNDILPLTFGYKSILVRNAIDEVKKAVKERCMTKGIAEKLYIAQGTGKLNGYYVSGIIEGLVHFGVVTPADLE